MPRSLVFSVYSTLSSDICKIEVIRPLRVRNILENVAQLKHVAQEVALLGKPRSTYYQGKGQIPIELLRKVASGLPCGDCSWVFYGTTYGEVDPDIPAETLASGTNIPQAERK